MERAASEREKNGQSASTWKPAAVRITALVLSAVFALAGILKLVGHWLGIRYFADKFVYDWEYGYPFLVLTGLAEVAAAALLFKPRTRYLGAMMVVFLMIGAIITHKKFGDPASAFLFPVLLLIAAIFITWNAHHIRIDSKTSGSESDQDSKSL